MELNEEMSSYFDQREVALGEIWVRGYDPVSRILSGRTLVWVRCSPRGHRLAQVVPSSLGPVLVPMVDEIPTVRYTDGKIRDIQPMPVLWFEDDQGRTLPTGLDIDMLAMTPSFLGPDVQTLRCRCGARTGLTRSALLSEALDAQRAGPPVTMSI